MGIAASTSHHLWIGCTPSNGRQLLHVVAEGKIAQVKEILEDDPQLASYIKPLVGISALHAAAAVGRADIVEALLGALECTLRGKSEAAAARTRHKVVNQRNIHGQTPLHLACKAGSPRGVAALLQAGADPTLFDGLSQSTCLHYAARYGSADVIDALLGDESWVTTASGQRSLLRHAHLVDSQGTHTYVDGRARLGLAPLHWAAAQGHLAATRALLKWGASVTVRCNLFLEDGHQGPWVPYSTPLHLAAARGDLHTACELLTGWVRQARQLGSAAWPDPRIMHDFWDRRPVDVARLAGHGSLLSLLSPGTVLQVAPPEPRIPTLASLASRALRTKLCGQLEYISAQQAQQERPPAQQQGPPGGRCPVCLGEGSAHGLSLYAAALSGSTKSERTHEDDGSVPVGSDAAFSAAAEATPAGAGAARAAQLLLRLSQSQHSQHAHQQPQQPLAAGWQLVAATSCRHAVCVSCAQELSRGGVGDQHTPCRCPLCRAVVAGWELASRE